MGTPGRVVSENLVALPPSGIILALQFWPGDEARALRLAQLIADIEPRRRDDVTFAFCRRFDMPEESAEAWKTRLHVGHKFGTIAIRSEREGVGHPDGCNELWAGTMDKLAALWRAGHLPRHSVFTLEADGVPLRADWIDRLISAHERTLSLGKRVTGAYMDSYPHINGSLIAHLSLWFDRPSLHVTPTGQAWDLFHAAVLRSEAEPTTWMWNIYGACAWSPHSLETMSKGAAWLSSQKDDSALAWAERTLVPRAPAPNVEPPTNGRVFAHG